MATTSSTCPKYVAPDDPLFEADRRRDPRRASCPYLQRMYPTLADDDVLAFRVSRVRTRVRRAHARLLGAACRR